MKKHFFHVSQNGWEYEGRITITANEVQFEWSDKHSKEYHEQFHALMQANGDVIIADGIRIELDEPFIYRGVVK